MTCDNKVIAKMAKRLMELEDEVSLLQARVEELEAEGIAIEQSEAEDGGSEDESSDRLRSSSDDEVCLDVSKLDSSDKSTFDESAQAVVDDKFTKYKRKRSVRKPAPLKKRK